MKKAIIIVLCILFALGAGIGFYFIKNPNSSKTTQNTDNTQEQENQEQNIITAQNLITLFADENNINVNAKLNNKSSENIKYLSEDTSIVDVDTNGNLLPHACGNTKIKSYFSLDNDVAFYTSVYVYPDSIDLTLELTDENGNIITSATTQTSYKLKAQATSNIEGYDISVLSSKELNLPTKKTILNNLFECNVEFPSAQIYDIYISINKTSTNSQKTFCSNTLTITTSSKKENTPEQNEPTESNPDEQTEQGEPEQNDPAENNDSTDPTTQDDNQNQPENNEENTQITYVFSDATPQIPNASFDASTNTLTVINFNTSACPAISFVLKNSTSTYTTQCEVLSGNITSQNITIETAFIGFVITQTGTSQVKFYTLQDASIYAIITIIVT